MPLNRKQTVKDFIQVQQVRDQNKEELKKKLKPTSIKAKIQTEGDRKN
jgi:hypothetical protein